MRHKHADLMIAFANDKTLKFQFLAKANDLWMDTGWPAFIESYEYRIKPKPVTKEEAKKAFAVKAIDGYAEYVKAHELLTAYFNQP